MTDKFKAWMDLLPKDRVNGMVVQSYEDVGDVYRIDNSQIKVFSPRVGDAQLPDEDRQVPRVCVGVSLISCIAAYGRFFSEHFTELGEEANQAAYKGGVYITRIPYEYCIQPKKKLLNDVGYTDEKWLVAYDKEHAEYKAEQIGKTFVSSVRLFRTDKKALMSEIEMMLEHDCKDGFRINGDEKVPPGYYKIFITGVRMGHNLDHGKHADKDQVKWTPMSKAEYLKTKASGLNLLDDSCTTLKW